MQDQADTQYEPPEELELLRQLGYDDGPDDGFPFGEVLDSPSHELPEAVRDAVEELRAAYSKPHPTHVGEKSSKAEWAAFWAHFRQCGAAELRVLRAYVQHKAHPPAALNATAAPRRDRRLHAGRPARRPARRASRSQSRAGSDDSDDGPSDEPPGEHAGRRICAAPGCVADITHRVAQARFCDGCASAKVRKRRSRAPREDGGHEHADHLDWVRALLYAVGELDRARRDFEARVRCRRERPVLEGRAWCCLCGHQYRGPVRHAERPPRPVEPRATWGDPASFPGGGRPDVVGVLLVRLQDGLRMRWVAREGERLGPEESGHDGIWSEAQLRRGWAVYRNKVMRQPANSTRPDRPWAWWVFDRGEPMPEHYLDRLRRLLELGELSEDELVHARQRPLEGVGLRR